MALPDILLAQFWSPGKPPEGLSGMRCQAEYRCSSLRLRLFDSRRQCKHPIKGVSKMTKLEVYPSFLDYLEYDGSTNIKLTRKQNGQTILQDWLMFDTVEAALEYFNDDVHHSPDWGRIKSRKSGRMH